MMSNSPLRNKFYYWFLACLPFLVALSFTPAQAATYYIDFQNGSDWNSGTSQSSPWQHIPGTRNVADMADQSTCWGSGCPGTPTFNSSNKVPAGTIIKLKCGTTYNSTIGGKIYIGAYNEPGGLGTAYYGSC
jgi:hypothetical protein